VKVISPHPPIPSHQKADVTSRAVLDVITKTSEYLQPNPSARAKLTMLNTVSKIRGQVKNPGYPQAEGLLGECMVKYGRELGEDTNFGTSGWWYDRWFEWILVRYIPGDIQSPTGRMWRATRKKEGL
jgi:hypothetical protein